jgi:hypothetical protein
MIVTDRWRHLVWNHFFFSRTSLKARMATLTVENLDENDEEVYTKGSDADKAKKAYNAFKMFALKADPDWPTINLDNDIHFESIQRILTDYLFYRFFEADATVAKHKVLNSELPWVYTKVSEIFHDVGLTSPDDDGRKGLRELKKSQVPLLANVLKTLLHILPHDLVGANPLFKQDIMRLQKSASPEPKGVRLVCFLYMWLYS